MFVCCTCLALRSSKTCWKFKNIIAFYMALLWYISQMQNDIVNESHTHEMCQTFCCWWNLPTFTNIFDILPTYHQHFQLCTKLTHNELEEVGIPIPQRTYAHKDQNKIIFPYLDVKIIPKDGNKYINSFILPCGRHMA